MPLYEFLCGRCQEVTEAIVSIKDDVHVVPCEKCGHNAKRIMSPYADFCNPDKRTEYPFQFGEPCRLNYSERRAAMKKHNLIEAGDRVKGSLNGALTGLTDYKGKKK